MSSAHLSLASLTTRLSSLQSQVDAATHHLDQLTRLVRLDQQYTDQVRADLTATCQRTADDLSAQLRAALARIDALERAGEEGRRRQEEALTGVEGRWGEVERRVGQLVQVVGGLEKGLGEVQGRGKAVEARVGGWEAALAGHAQRLEQLVKEVRGDVGSCVQSVQGERERVRGEVEGLRGEVGRLAGEQREELLGCVEDLRRFQLEVRAEMERRERRWEVVRRAVVEMSEEMAGRGGGGGGGSRGVGGVGGGGGGGEGGSGWQVREEERREREEREVRRVREMGKRVKREVLQHLDDRILRIAGGGRGVGEGRGEEMREEEGEEEQRLRLLEEMIGRMREGGGGLGGAERKEAPRRRVSVSVKQGGIKTSGAAVRAGEGPASARSGAVRGKRKEEAQDAYRAMWKA